MKLSVQRDTLLKPLQAVQGVVERRQTLPILTNVLVTVREGQLEVTATDMELELVARTSIDGGEPGEITLPARKLVDICRSLPSDAMVDVSVDGDKAIVRSGRSRFTLSTLPASEYPSADSVDPTFSVEVSRDALKRLIELTHFAMAQQDVRYYLNGLLVEIEGDTVRAVATDGHRLAVCELRLDEAVGDGGSSIILPRKGVGELLRLLGGADGTVQLALGGNALQASFGDVRLTSKLIDGKFPDYQRVIPVEENCDKRIEVDRETVRQALSRASILSNDKYRAVRLTLEAGLLRVVANNPEQEEAQEEIPIEYEGEGLEIGFNVSYLIDALAAVPTVTARLLLTDASSSCLVTPVDGEDACRFVVMPMRL
jgi:DNA polymerase-3 subunit beta